MTTPTDSRAAWALGTEWKSRWRAWIARYWNRYSVFTNGVYPWVAATPALQDVRCFVCGISDVASDPEGLEKYGFLESHKHEHEAWR